MVPVVATWVAWAEWVAWATKPVRLTSKNNLRNGASFLGAPFFYGR